MPPLRCLQICTAAAALFVILGACGLPPPGRATPPVVRPPPPRPHMTIRSLTGTWLGGWQTPEGVETLTMSIVQSGSALSGTLTTQADTFATDPGRPAHVDVNGRFALEFGRSHERVVVRGRPDASADRIVASVTGLSTDPVPVTFRRR
jgi:hypothetical protein